MFVSTSRADIWSIKDPLRKFTQARGEHAKSIQVKNNTQDSHTVKLAGKKVFSCTVHTTVWIREDGIAVLNNTSSQP